MDNRKSGNKMTLYIVVPCYNEEEVLPISAPILSGKIQALIEADQISDKSRVVFVDDGSADSTWKFLADYCQACRLCSAVKLSANRGHQNALLAGMEFSKDRSDAVITIDADLQDDSNCVDKMVEQYYEGCEVVYGIRSSREKDSFFKRTTAEMFYKLMNVLGAKTVYNHADYRLLGKAAVKALLEYKESNLYLRGIVPELGFKTASVYYERSERLAGETKYPLKKMIMLAINGITSFSVKPVRSIFVLGLVTFIISIFIAIYIIIGSVMGKTVSGWSSTVLSIWFFGSLQLMATGIIGEYIGKTYIETKERPKFIVERIIENEAESSESIDKQ